MPARIKVRIRSVKLDGLTFDQQCERLRIATEIDRRFISTSEFAHWSLANIEAIKVAATNWRPSK